MEYKWPSLWIWVVLWRCGACKRQEAPLAILVIHKSQVKCTFSTLWQVDLTTPNTEGVNLSPQNMCKSERICKKKGELSSPPYLPGAVELLPHMCTLEVTSRCCCGTARHCIGHITWRNCNFKAEEKRARSIFKDDQTFSRHGPCNNAKGWAVSRF